MARNADGSANCDRCGVRLAGYGAHYGMVCTDLGTAGQVRDWIFCYVNACRSVVLTGFITYLTNTPVVPVRCTDDNQRLENRAVAEAMLAVDENPASGDARYMQFCYSHGSRDRFLANMEASK